uniref:Uncharacterized protein n=1 Tax=Avena sativa TaxID=4498 RepID=A0ACD5V3E2_AVESA
MDPDGSYPKKFSSIKSADNFSPLHEVFRGTTAMPVSNDHEDLKSSSPHSSSMGSTQSITQVLQEATMMLISRKKFHDAIPKKCSPLAPTTLNVVNKIPSQANSTEISQIQQEIIARQDFLRNPIGNYFDSSQQIKILSMEPPSFTSLLQEDPIAVVHAHLNTIGGLDEGPIYEMPTKRVSEVQHEMLSRGDPDGVPTPLVPSARSTQAPREEKNPVGASNKILDSATYHGSTTSRRYTCKICNSTFNSPQAYGGHMSSHSKARKKNQLV